MRKALFENKPWFIKVFDKVFIAVFALFIFLIFTFGRAFSIIHAGNIYITEIVLFLCLLFLICNFKDIFAIPANLLKILCVYFIFCSMRLAADMLGGNFYALRGLVYFGYILFLPVTLIIFSGKDSLRRFILIIITGNIIALLLVRFCIYRQQPVIPWLIFWWGQMKAFNYMIYFAFAQSFLICLFPLAKGRATRFFMVLLCAFNSYIIFIWGIRSSWVAFIVLFPFLILMLKKKFFSFLVYFVPIFLILASVLGFYLDRDVFKEEVFLTKLQSLTLFVKNSVIRNGDLSLTIKKILRKEIVYVGKNELLEQRESAAVTKGQKDVKTKLSKNSLALEGKVSSELPIKEGERSVAKDTEDSKIKESKVLIYEDPFLKDEMSGDEGVVLTRRQDRINYFSNIQWRLSLWKAALRSGLESPIIGKGFGIDVRRNYSVSYQSSMIKPKAFIIPIHNHFISIFYKTGIIGLGLFLLINVYSFFYGLKYLKECKSEFIKYFLIALIGCLIFWHSMALFFDVIDSPPTSIFLWVILGLIFACVHADRKILDTAKYEQT